MSSHLPKMPSYVYFIRRVDGEGPIKIGYSTQPKARCTNIAQMVGAKLEILAFTPGGFADERLVHARFAASRVEGEWFSPTSELLSYIEEIRRSGELNAKEAICGRVVQRVKPQDIRSLFLRCRRALRLRQWEWGVLLGFDGERDSVARKIRRYESGETDIDGPMKKLVEIIATVLDPLLRAAADGGGHARAASLSPTRRSEIARDAAAARWSDR